MSNFYEDDEEIQVLFKLYKFANQQTKKFNRRYIDEIYDYFESYGYITKPQYDALYQIYFHNDVASFFDEEL